MKKIGDEISDEETEKLFFWISIQLRKKAF